MSDDRKRRFARFYYDDFIREYPSVYEDAQAFAAWMWCLVVAEKSWPTQPELPRAVNGRALRVLVDAGLIAIGPRYTFALLGHDKDRARRYAGAIAGANASANARANVQRPHEPSLSLEEEKRREGDTPPPSQAMGRRSNGTNPRALGTNPRAQGTSPRQELQREKRNPTSIHDILSGIQRKP